MLSILAVCITLASLCQELSEAEIARVINMSKEANFINNGVIDPDKIQIGQTLTFRFQDGTEKRITVEKGDSQWKILKDKIGNLIIAHGQVVPYPIPSTPDVKPSEDETDLVTPSEKTDFTWLWILLGIAVVSIVVWIYRLAKKNKNEAEAEQNPVTSGPAMRPGGITDENALAYATQVASRQFNNPNLQVREVQRGMLSGENLEVFYAGNATPQRRTFTNQPAYRGIVNLNGADQFVYFLQGCGNDVRMGNYFTGQNIQFIADATSPVLRAQPTTTTEQSTPAQETQPIMQMVKVMVEALKDKVSGKMTITNVDGVKVEMFFSNGPISFSSNGNAENAIKLEEKSHVK